MPTTPQPPFDQIFSALRIDPRDPHAARRRVELLEMLLERSIPIPGLKRPIGLDAIVGLIPVVGDAISAAMGAYIVWEARNMGVPKWKIWRMIANLGVDTAIGAIPVAGDAFDLIFRSNSRNLRILKKHLDKHVPASQVVDGTVVERQGLL
jgi:hypothetical protein